MPMTITLEPEVEKRIDALAEHTGQGKDVILKMVIENGAAGKQPSGKKKKAGAMA